MMAKFEKAALRKLVEGQFQEEIDQMTAKIAELKQRRAHEEEVAEWREAVEKSLRDVTRGFDGLSNEYLMRFRLPPYPHNVAQDIQSYEQRIEMRKSQRQNTLRIIEALAADKDGNVNLTTADVRGIGIGMY